MVRRNRAQQRLRRTIRLLCLPPLIAAGCGADHRRENPVPAPTARAEAPRPFFDARAHPAEYVGPGREKPPPDKIEEVKIGYFGPDDPNHPIAGQMWQAATLAIEEANRAGGYDGLPFRLVPAWSESPWGTGIKDVTRLVYGEKIWAIVGAPDGPSAHLVAQAVAKARLVFISAVATDKKANLANVPWIFSCAPGDHLQAPTLAKAVVAQSGEQASVVVSCADHDSRTLLAELQTSFNKIEAFPALHVEFAAGDTGFATHIQRLRQACPAAVVLVAGPQDAARFLIALRRDGFTTPVFGGPAMGHRLFAEQAGDFAEGAVFPLLWNPSIVGERAAAFARQFERRFGNKPDYTAAHTYDAVNLLVAAIRKASLNRVRIRDAVRERSPWPGVTGPITWDPTGHNHRSVSLGTIRSGCLSSLDRETFPDPSLDAGKGFSTPQRPSNVTSEMPGPGEQRSPGQLMHESAR